VKWSAHSDETEEFGEWAQAASTESPLAALVAAMAPGAKTAEVSRARTLLWKAKGAAAQGNAGTALRANWKGSEAAWDERRHGMDQRNRAQRAMMRSKMDARAGRVDQRRTEIRAALGKSHAHDDGSDVSTYSAVEGESETSGKGACLYDWSHETGDDVAFEDTHMRSEQGATGMDGAGTTTTSGEPERRRRGSRAGQAQERRVGNGGDSMAAGERAWNEVSNDMDKNDDGAVNRREMIIAATEEPAPTSSKPESNWTRTRRNLNGISTQEKTALWSRNRMLEASDTMENANEQYQTVDATSGGYTQYQGSLWPIPATRQQYSSYERVVDNDGSPQAGRAPEGTPDTRRHAERHAGNALAVGPCAW